MIDTQNLITLSTRYIGRARYGPIFFGSR